MSIYKPRGVALAPLSARPSSSRRPCTTSSSPSPLPPLFGYSNPLSLSFSLLFAEEGSLRRYSLLPLRPTGRMIAPKGPSRARRAFSTYMRVTAFHPPVCQEEGRGREGGRGREKDSRLEIRSIGLIGLRRHGLAARAPPIARTQHGRRI